MRFQNEKFTNLLEELKKCGITEDMALNFISDGTKDVDVYFCAEDRIEQSRDKQSTNGEKFSELLDQGMLGTELNHPGGQMMRWYIARILTAWYVNVRNGYTANLNNYNIHFSREYKMYGIPLRSKLEKYNYDKLILGVLKRTYYGAKMKMESEKDEKWQAVCEYIYYLYKFIKKHYMLFFSFLMELNEETEFDIIDTRNKLATSLDTIFKDAADENKNIEALLSSCLYTYVNSLDPKEVFKNAQIEINNVSETALNVLKNADEFSLKASFNGKLLDGKINVAANRGYPSMPEHSQQDAVGSAVKSENCFINVVADGVGGGEYGERASRQVVDSLITWFNNLSDEQLSNISLLCKLLETEIQKISDNIVQSYFGKTQSTVVLSLTVGDKTIIANIGDSTAYTYNENNDSLEMLSTLDSVSYGLSYESARHNPSNNIVTAVIGASKQFPLHINIIDNYGQKIILSSDGVTDLVSEERFKSYFKHNVDAQDIIQDALSKVDIDSPNMKAEDNISAIVVTLPNGGLNKGRGSR